MHSIRASAALSVSRSCMLYAVGLFHPPPGENGHLPAGYDLTAAELAELGDLQGVPITLEHVGVSAAVTQLVRGGKEVEGLNVGKVMDGLCEADAKVAPVGVCLDVDVGPKGYYVLFALDTVAWPVVSLLFPHMQGLSLSHMSYKNKLVPLEVSLCIRPARPGCYCSFSGSDYVEALTYMRSQTGMATMAANEPSKIEAILAKLPEEEQKIISARFETMVAEIQKQRSEAHSAINKAEELKAKTTESNIKLLEWGLKNIETHLPEDVQKTFNCGSSAIMPELASNDAEAVRRAVDRLICACSHTMMKMSAATVPAPAQETRKRARSVSPAPEPEPVRATLPVGAPKSNEDLLKEAMANTFGPFSA